MIFTIQTNDEVAGIDISLALMNAGIQHTILSKQHDKSVEKSRKKIRAYVVKLSNPQELISDERLIVSVDKERDSSIQVVGNPCFINVGEIYQIPIYQVDPNINHD